MATAAFLFICLQAVFYLYKILPNDISRTQIIFSTLKDTSVQPSIIILGDSRAVFGIDAKAISKNLPGQALAYNLASVGQSVQEGAHFFTMLSPSVKHVLHCIPFENFALTHIRLPDNKAVAMRMYGYSLDTATEKIVQEVNPILHQSKWHVAFQARNLLISSLNVIVREMLDDEKFNNNFHDLYFPHIYTTSRHPRYPFNGHSINFDSLKVNPLLTNLVQRVHNYCKQRDIFYHVVLMPMNPDVPVPTTAVRNTYLTEVRKQLPSVDIMDMAQELVPTEFYDWLHPNKAGAEKLSIAIANLLKEHYKLSDKTSSNK